MGAAAVAPLEVIGRREDEIRPIEVVILGLERGRLRRFRGFRVHHSTL
jgi:hypothetical protein